MQGDIDRVLISREQIAQRVRGLADEIAAVYADDAAGLVIVPILAGSLIFCADLIRCLPFKMRIALMTISSYRDKTTVGATPQVVHDLTADIRGRHVLVVDDILDTGNTLGLVMRDLARRQPASLRMCVLLRKKGKAPPSLKADFVGFDIEDVFVVGYGLDYDNHYRNAPDIGVLRPELYA
ncbi:MAG: hypoxanthine phosphoribosyltransferase [Phycisphaerae bacterium]|nr:hypoxanthine phosphoribosyltransferase [Phycisphaerae bacterium]